MLQEQIGNIIAIELWQAGILRFKMTIYKGADKHGGTGDGF
jgi:hypothetical protein